MKTHHKVIAAIVAAAAFTSAGVTNHVHTLKSAALAHAGLSGPSELYPDLTKTPGATNADITQDTIAQTICNPSWSTKSIRPPVSYTSPLKAKQIAAEYTYNGDTNFADYELDHLISLELGGNPTSEQNLWPEPYHTQVSGAEVGAHQKDTVENYLHKQVCTGALTLAEAQHEVVTDWYAVYISIPTSHFGALGDAYSGDPDDVQ